MYSDIVKYREFVSKYFDNSENVCALIEELGLFPAELLTPSIQSLFKSIFKRESTLPFDDFTRDYLENLSKHYQKFNHSRRWKGSDLLTCGDLNLF